MTRTFLQNRLNVANKSRSNIFNWRGQFTPQFIDYLLDELASNTTAIADPFCGSGTVLLEAASRDLVAYGLELNPAAYAMAKFFTLANFSFKHRIDLASQVEKHMSASFRDFGDLPLWESSSSYREKAKNLLLIGRALFDSCQTKSETLLIALTLFEAEATRNGELLPTVRNAFERIRSRLYRLPHVECAPRVSLCDARLADTAIHAECDMILTSPPYINVFNYHQNHRAIVELLGFDILRVARSEIGSNRKNRQNRFRTVVQYAMEMEHCLKAFSRILKPDGLAVIVLGRESNVRGVPFQNGTIVIQVAEQSGMFVLDSRHERSFTNRFGTTIFEDILIFVMSSAVSQSNVAIDVAAQHLEEGLALAEGEVAEDIRETLATIHNIPESPVLERTPIL
uniref:RNA methylase family UPF0020 n=1 Tax=Candidatus Kentrum sp. TC TaxID=2126339 RepID=A0A450YCF5_9GAMM|nr:MAG: Putative RNA methylase family UPF0020 [Candidatus Kentron sp. TC]VFK54916.1 MAG: Putative RNA methylase family UPF0020 [Candidatus Kentron sp. TC]